jgi:hypothetical protein
MAMPCGESPRLSSASVGFKFREYSTGPNYAAPVIAPYQVRVL